MFKLLKKNLAKSIKSGKLKVFLFFFLLSFSVLLFTKLSQKYSDTIVIKIEPKNIAENRILQMDSLPEVRVDYSDYGIKILLNGFQDLEFSLNLENNTEELENQYRWVPEQNREEINKFLSNSAEINAISPETVIISFDTLSTKKVPVILQSQIDFALGYDSLNQTIISPDSIELIGSNEQLKQIETILTEELVLSSVKKDIDELIDLKRPENFSEVKYSPNQVNIKIGVDKFTEGTIDVPVSVTNIPENTDINFFPKTIKVVYYVSLENYNSVKLSDFRINCDFKNAKENQRTYFVPNLTVKNSDIKAANMRQNKVEYIIVR